MEFQQRLSPRSPQRIRKFAVGVAMAALAGLLGIPNAPAAPATPLPKDGNAVVLPTGDSVLMQSTAPTGRSDLSMVPADRSGITTGFQSLLVGGAQYVFPNEVQPLIGSLVDPSLFDVTRLAKQPGPVTVVATTTSADAAVPGLTVTERTSDTVTGHVTPSGSAAFRAALLSAAKAVRAGKSPSGLSGVSKLSTTASPVMSPRYEQVTLKIEVTGTDGNPDPYGYIALVNMDDSRRYSRITAYSDGEARVSVPLGNYAAFAAITQFPTDTTAVNLAMPVADFAVTKNLQTLSFDARDARINPTVSTPKPAQVDRYGFEYSRFPVTDDGDPLVVQNLVDATSTTVLYAPSKSVKHGRLNWNTRFHSVGARTHGTPYSYDLTFLTTGKVPASGTSKIAVKDLARIDAGYYNDASYTTGNARVPHYPFTENGFGYFAYFQTPTRRTEYVNGGTGVWWGEQIMGNRYAPGGLGNMVEVAGRMRYPVGSKSSVDWLRGPLAPGLARNSGKDPNRLACSACRTATGMNISLTPFNDTVPGHNGGLTLPADGTPAIVTSLTAGGVTVAGGDNQTFLTTAVPAKPTTYRLKVTTNRTGNGTSTSTGGVTVYGFDSSSTTGRTLPPELPCSLSTDQAQCRTLGLLQVTALLPTDLHNRLPVGASHFTLTVAPYLDNTTRTTAEVSTSLDGTTFTPATVVRTGPQAFKVKLVNPEAGAGKPVTLRVTARDANGNTVTQTTTAAYIVHA
ncbi:hypothetical protein [Streptomyces sp. bgisy027]|uniref:hypothetical protein n=1 Tax=unclassified Streptomyces TaxID=2593676 RepID=UPI003D7374A7